MALRNNKIDKIPVQACLDALDSALATAETAIDALEAGGGGETSVVVQVVNKQISATSTSTATFPIDNTIPQIGEGAAYDSLSITPTSATNKLKITVQLNASGFFANSLILALFKDADADAIGIGVYTLAIADINTVILTAYITAGTTSATEIKVRVGGFTTNEITYNGYNANPFWGGVFKSSITIEEILVPQYVRINIKINQL